MASATRLRSTSLTIGMTRSCALVSLPTSRGTAAAERAAAAREAASRAATGAAPASRAAAPGARNDDGAAVAPSALADARGVGSLARLCLDHQQRQPDEKDQHDQRRRKAAASISLYRGAGARLHRFGVAEQHVTDVLHAGFDAGGEIAAPERRQDRILDDELAHGVGELGLQPAPDLDAHLALLGRYDQNYAVVLALLAELPAAAELIAKVLDFIALQRRRRVDHELIGGLLFQRLQLALEPPAVLGGQQLGFVDDAPAERRELGGGQGTEARRQQKGRQGHQQADGDGERARSPPPRPSAGVDDGDRRGKADGPSGWHA